MAYTFSYLAFREDETAVMLTYSYSPGTRPVFWGDYPDPGSPPEVDICEAKDKQGISVRLTPSEREAFERDILENHEEPTRDPDDARDEMFDREMNLAFWDSREEIDF